jgi:hypothetical protein
MSAPVQLNITVITNAGGASGGTLTSSVLVVPIPSALQTLDSTVQGSTQTGFSAVDELVRAIFRAGVFYVASTGTWYSTDCIQSITAQ